MTNIRHRALAIVGAASSVFVLTIALDIAPAHGTPAPDVCAPATGVDDVCTARLTSVTADTINGTITGTPADGGAPITLAGQADAYLKSAGFGDSPPEAVQNWDATIDRVTNANANADPSGPGWYGNAKSMAFLPRTLDELAVHFPPNTIVVRFTPADANAGALQLVSIQPVVG